MKSNVSLLAILLCLGPLLMADSGAPQSSRGLLEKSACNDIPVEILSNSGGVDFCPCLTTIVKKIVTNWYLLMGGVYPLIRSRVTSAVIALSITRTGALGPIKDRTSRRVELDNAATGAITRSARFPELPDDYKAQQLSLRMAFSYNPPEPKR